MLSNEIWKPNALKYKLIYSDTNLLSYCIFLTEYCYSKIKNSTVDWFPSTSEYLFVELLIFKLNFILMLLLFILVRLKDFYELLQHLLLVLVQYLGLLNLDFQLCDFRVAVSDLLLRMSYLLVLLLNFTLIFLLIRNKTLTIIFQ